MLKREWGAESNWKLPHLFIPSKTATQVLEFSMEDLPLGRIAALVPEFAVKDLPLGRALMMMMVMMMMIYRPTSDRLRSIQKLSLRLCGLKNTCILLFINFYRLHSLKSRTFLHSTIQCGLFKFKDFYKVRIIRSVPFSVNHITVWTIYRGQFRMDRMCE